MKPRESKAHGSPRARASPQRKMILLDQNPLRRTAAEECRNVRAEIDGLRATWHRFEREDKPGFARWRAREFGPLLSELRETEATIREIETLVHEVEMEMRRGFYDARAAYQRVKARRANPGAIETESERQAHPGRSEESKVSDFEKEALFQEWVRKYIGTNPDKLDDEAYSTTFEAFKIHMFRTRNSDPLPKVDLRTRRTETPPPAEKEPEMEEIDARVKQLYRLLVRRLHPDLRADGSTAVSSLWHEVQEAYAATDIAHLEILLALSDIQANPFRDEMSLSQMRSVVGELRRAVFALEDSLRQARSEEAWEFARVGPSPELRTAVERELRANLRRRSERLAMLRQTIEAWSSAPRIPREGAIRERVATYR